MTTGNDFYAVWLFLFSSIHVIGCVKVCAPLTGGLSLKEHILFAVVLPELKEPITTLNAWLA